jgi:hypothetical protein
MRTSCFKNAPVVDVILLFLGVAAQRSLANVELDKYEIFIKI